MNAAELLYIAAKGYDSCAHAITEKLANPPTLTPDELESRIAFGIASDWTKRAAALEPLRYNKRHLNKSARTAGVSELIRFNMAWSGMNTLFARDSILKRLGPGSSGPAILQRLGAKKAKGPKKAPRRPSELECFRFLYAHVGLQSAQETLYVARLTAILADSINTTLPNSTVSGPFSVLQVFHYKYTPVHLHDWGVSKKIETAFAANCSPNLDLPTLIYLTRNWSVHGTLIDSSFRNTKRFKDYIDTILVALAHIHVGCSQTLRAKL